MKASEDKDEFTLRISASEEAAFMDMMNSIYNKSLKARSSDELLDLLVVADKFIVTCCITKVVELLLKLPMTTDSALFCLKLPLFSLGNEFEPLKEGVIKNLASQFLDFNRSRQERAMELPLSVIEAILGSEGLRVTTEYDVAQFILEWSRIQYPELQERQEIVKSLFRRFICPSYMSCSELKETVDCPELGSLVLLRALEDEDDEGFSFPRRVYARPVIKVVRLNFPQPRCTVFLDVHKQQCLDTFATSRPRIDSSSFCLGGRSFLICLVYNPAQNKFSVNVQLVEGSQTCNISTEFGVVSKTSKQEFIRLVKYNMQLTKSIASGYTFQSSWSSILNIYFIEDILHFQLDITFIA